MLLLVLLYESIKKIKSWIKMDVIHWLRNQCNAPGSHNLNNKFHNFRLLTYNFHTDLRTFNYTWEPVAGWSFRLTIIDWFIWIVHRQPDPNGLINHQVFQIKLALFNYWKLCKRNDVVRTFKNPTGGRALRAELV